ncbi:ABC transporter ATP-binding protein [Sediminispirochaeta bajacaliforniensis]|uniref:ABC transporter ATP-binding protein n=1 Tax=Sediminispirochaeta bajacaliforniensis TaxID=148 RepID=UPI00037CEAB2|nr:ABC transporter ATP-binding protein [Sediminispirochaeta bajacaliforniensis]
MEPALVLEGITKVYPGVVANRNISFSLNEGEIHAICGENGAGKSTLMKIIFGMEQPSEGKIFLKGKEVHIRSPQDAIDLGIGMVHQHFMLVPSFTVAENLVLGMEPSRYTKLDKGKAIAETREVAEQFELKVTPEARVEDIGVAMMQKLEILKALYRGARILILDEPTAVLTPQETDELFEQLLVLKKRGHTIVFISHKLKEVKQISDRITVIRKGEVAGRFLTSQVDEREISEAMIGKIMSGGTKWKRVSPGRQALRAEALSLVDTNGRPVLRKLSFSLREGEILGVAGVEGNGQRELIELITGQRRLQEGSLSYGEKELRPRNIGQVRSLGLAYIPEDRMRNGCATGGAIWENLITNRLSDKRFSRRSWLRKREIENDSRTLVGEYDIRCSSIADSVGQLSGGNIQKVVVARECASDPSILVADQPTRGVDINSAEQIHRKIIEMSRNQTAVLLVSADLGELLDLCTSLIVLFNGEITARFDDISDLDEKELGFYMLGIKRQGDEA